MRKSSQIVLMVVFGLLVVLVGYQAVRAEVPASAADCDTQEVSSTVYKGYCNSNTEAVEWCDYMEALHPEGGCVIAGPNAMFLIPE